MLQLVNDGNVEIVKSSEGSTENFSLHLHKTSLAAERFAAPHDTSVSAVGAVSAASATAPATVPRPRA